jgi:hypothetical protein
VRKGVQQSAHSRLDAENAANGSSATMGTRSSPVPAALQQLRAQQQVALQNGLSITTERKAKALSPKPLASTTSSAKSNKTTSSSGSSSNGSTRNASRASSISPGNSLNVSQSPTARAKSPPANRSLQKLLGYPVAPLTSTLANAANSSNLSLNAASMVESPFKLRKPSPTELADQTFSFSVQDVDDYSTTAHSVISVPRRDDTGARAESPSPRSKHARSHSMTTNPAVLMLHRTSSGTQLAHDRDSGCRSPLTPSSILRLKQQQRTSGAASPTGSVGRSPHTTSFRGTTAAPLEPFTPTKGSTAAARDFQSDDELESGPLEQLDVATSMPSFGDILQRMRGTIGTGLVHVGSALGARAEKALVDSSYLLPLYSTAEMDQVMSKKHTLLNELSQSCMLLGQAEEREKQFTVLQSRVVHLEAEARERGEALENAQQVVETNAFKIKALETELSVVKGERAQELDSLRSYREEAARLQRGNDDLQARLTEASEKASRSALQCNQLQSELQQSEERWSQITRAAKDETAAAKANAHSLAQRLQAAERDRDQSLAELEVMQEMATTDKHSAASEFARLREAMASQQYLYKEQLVKNNEELSAAKRELSDSQAGLATFKELHSQIEDDKAQLQARLQAAAAEASELASKVSAYEQDLRTCQEELSYQKKQTADAQSQLQQLQMQLVVSNSEHGMLSDQTKMAELTVSALHTEIGMLRREVEDQRDITKAKEIEVMSAVTRYNTSQEELQLMRLEMGQLEQRSTRLLEDNQEEVAVLETTIAGLRAEAVEQARVRLDLSEQLDAEAARHRELELTSYSSTLTLQKALDEARAESQALSQQNDELEGALSALRSAHEQLKAEQVLMTEQGCSTQARVQAEVIALRRTLAEVEDTHTAALDLKESDLAALQTKYAIAEDTLTRLRAESARLASGHKLELQQKDTEIVSLAEGRALVVEQLESQSRSYEEALAAAKGKYEQREKDFVSALTLAEATQDSVRDGLRSELAEATTRCETQTKQLAQLQDQLAAAEDQSVKASEDAQLLSSTIDVLNGELSENRAEVATLEAKLAESEAAAQHAASQSAHLQSELAAQKASHTQQVSDNDKRYTKLQAESVRLMELHANETAVLQVEPIPRNIIYATFVIRRYGLCFAF